MDVVQKAVGIVTCAAHRESENEGDQEDADGVVPIKELEAIVLDALVGVGPRTPADSTDGHHQQGNCTTVRREHGSSSRYGLSRRERDRWECTLLGKGSK